MAAAPAPTTTTGRRLEHATGQHAARHCPLLALQGGIPRPDCACGRTTAEESSCPDC